MKTIKKYFIATSILGVLSSAVSVYAASPNREEDTKEAFDFEKYQEHVTKYPDHEAYVASTKQATQNTEVNTKPVSIVDSNNEAIEAVATQAMPEKLPVGTVPPTPPVQQAQEAIQETAREHQRTHAVHSFTNSLMLNTAQQIAQEQQKQEDYEVKQNEDEVKEEAVTQEVPFALQGLSKSALPDYEAVDLNTRTLLIFFDNSEMVRADKNNGFTKEVGPALCQEAGPILITGALLAHVFNIDGNHAEHNKPILLAFYKEFDATRWVVYQCDTQIDNECETFFLLIPRHDLETGAVSLKDFNVTDAQRIELADQKDALSTYFCENNKEKHNYFREKASKQYREKERIIDPNFAEHFLTLFFNMLSKRNETGEINWVIYFGSHGKYLLEIAAGLSIKGENSQFQRFLTFCSNETNIKLLVIDTCYLAGFNAKKVFGKLIESTPIKMYPDKSTEPAHVEMYPDPDKSIESAHVKTYPFTMVTASTSDAVSYPCLIGVNKEDNITSEMRFDAFIKEAKKKIINYPLALSYIFPLINRTPRFPCEIGSIPQIRPPHASDWFPIVDVDKAVIRIGRVMVEAIMQTKEPSLVIKQYEGLDGQMHDPKAVLLEVDQIQFPIIIDKNIKKIPTFISLLPGVATHTLPSITYTGAPFNFFDFSGGLTYACMKKFMIDTLTILNNKKETEMFKKVEIETKEGNSKAFGTNQYGNQYTLYDSAEDKLYLGALGGRAGFIIKDLLDEADIDEKRYYADGAPLYFAIAWGWKEAAKLLLEYGANPDIEVYKGVTARTNNPKMVHSIEQELAQEQEIKIETAQLLNTHYIQKQHVTDIALDYL